MVGGYAYVRVQGAQAVPPHLVHDTLLGAYLLEPARRGYPFAEFLDDARAAGWAPDLLLSTWDLRPFTEDADFLVAVLRRA